MKRYCGSIRVQIKSMLVLTAVFAVASATFTSFAIAKQGPSSINNGGGTPSCGNSCDSAGNPTDFHQPCTPVPGNGCHTLPDKDVGADPNRVPWRYVKAKYKPAALVEFLKQPEKHFAWIRMPNFRFTDEEAISVAAYLLSTSKELEAPAAGRRLCRNLAHRRRCVYSNPILENVWAT